MPRTLAFPEPTLADASSPGLTCTLDDDDLGTAWLRVTGELDIATVPRVAHLLGAAEQFARLIVVDLCQLTFIDCSGIHLIVDADRRAWGLGYRLIVVRGPARVDRVFTLTAASQTVELVDLETAKQTIEALRHLAPTHKTA
jgi:anti-sigma B factor antagonist